MRAAGAARCPPAVSGSGSGSGSGGKLVRRPAAGAATMSGVTKLSAHWPLADLVVRTPRLELRWPHDDDLAALAELAAEGIHDPDDMPFLVPWSRAPAGELERNVIQRHWSIRASWTPDAWRWNPVVVVDGAIVGTQDLRGEAFAVRRTVSTGSWLGRAHQGQGIGTEMRAAVLHLAFAGLGAERAETSAFTDNPASQAVTRRLGYEPNGDEVQVVEGRARVDQRFVLRRDRWEQTRRHDIAVEGLHPCLPLFGATSPAADRGPSVGSAG
jgi:RimJ/RimL family protein N-acetyltransferase